MNRDKTAWGTVIGTGAASVDIVLMDKLEGTQFSVADIEREIRSRKLKGRGAIRRHLDTLQDRGHIERSGDGWRISRLLKTAGDGSQKVGPNAVDVRKNRVVTLHTVRSPEDVLKSLKRFNRDARRYAKRAKSILRQTSYWTYHRPTGAFGPGKFIGFRNMTFDDYDKANLGHSTGAAFQGGVTKHAIEMSLKQQFTSNDLLVEELKHWGNRLLGTNAFGNAESSKWSFVVLDGNGDEVSAFHEIEAVAEVILARGQGFIADPRLRKLIEDEAMRRATEYFQSLKYVVKDVSKTKPYDLYCTRKQEVVYVEVKGTQSDGERVILTINEVEHANTHREQMVLFILKNVVAKMNGSEWQVEAGDPKVIRPWDVDSGVLRAISYNYDVPLEGKK